MFDVNEVRICVTCKQPVSHPAQWWEFVSLSCQTCDSKRVYEDTFGGYQPTADEPF